MATCQPENWKDKNTYTVIALNDEKEQTNLKSERILLNQRELPTQDLYWI
jgi:hypothetical protein